LSLPRYVTARQAAIAGRPPDSAHICDTDLGTLRIIAEGTRCGRPIGRPFLRLQRARDPIAKNADSARNDNTYAHLLMTPYLVSCLVQHWRVRLGNDVGVSDLGVDALHICGFIAADFHLVPIPGNEVTGHLHEV